MNVEILSVCVCVCHGPARYFFCNRDPLSTFTWNAAHGQELATCTLGNEGSDKTQRLLQQVRTVQQGRPAWNHTVIHSSSLRSQQYYSTAGQLTCCESTLLLGHKPGMGTRASYTVSKEGSDKTQRLLEPQVHLQYVRTGHRDSWGHRYTYSTTEQYTASHTGLKSHVTFITLAPWRLRHPSIIFNAW